MNPEQLAQHVDELYSESLAQGAKIQTTDFLAWPFWCLDLEMRFCMPKRANDLESAIIKMGEDGLNTQEIMAATGLDSATVSAAIEGSDGSATKRIGNLILEKIFFDGILGKFLCRRQDGLKTLKDIRQIDLPPGRPRLIWPLVRPPLPSEISADTIRQLLDSRDDLDELFPASENDLMEIVAVYENLRYRMLYSLVCIVAIISGNILEWHAFDVISQEDLRLKTENWETLKKHDIVPL